MTARTDSTDMLGSLGASWGWILFYGIVTLLLGIAVLVWPAASLITLAILFGIQLLVAGIFEIVAAFAREEETGGMRVLYAILGILSIIVGIWCLRNPGFTVLTLSLLLGIFWVVHGLIEMVSAIADSSTPSRGWRIFGGILSVLAGLVVLVWPGITPFVLIWVLGIFLVVYGIILIISSFGVRSAGREMAPAV
jgi:uncharacterized membrane protein HdeD (DUF308 family)